ncbi:MAG: tetratricopeptide repeat protein [Gelidibacter sp.]
MKSLVVFSFLVIFSLPLVAQEKEIDSLERLLGTHTKKDTVRLDAFNDLMYLYQIYDPDKGLAIGKEAQALAESLKDPKRLSYVYNNIANNYLAKGQDSMALVYYDKNIEINTHINNAKGIAKTIFNKGIVYSNRSEFNKSIQCNDQAYAYFSKVKDSALMARVLNSTGIYYMNLSENTKSLKSFQESLNIYEKLGLQQNVEYGNTLNNIGLLYKNLEKLTVSADYYQRALVVFRAANYNYAIANTLGNLAVVNDLLNNPSKAIELLNESLSIYKEIGNERGIASSMSNLAIANTALSKFDEALEYLNQTKAMYQKWNDDANLAIINNAIGETYMTMSSKGALPASVGYDTAVQYFNKALYHSKQAKSIRQEQDSYENLSQTWYKQGNYKKAYEAKERSIVLKDSMFSMEKKEEIVRMEEQFRFDKETSELKAKNEKEQALGMAEIKRQKVIKNGSIIGGTALLCSLFFWFVTYKRKRDAISQKKEAEFNTTVANTELKALRAQMNPHFIFNSLNSINDFISKNDAESAQNYLTKFAKMMRRTLESSNQKEITLEDDLKLLELYLQIEAIRLQHKFTYDIKVDEGLDKENTLIPPLILQPFIENSIWHGISNKEGKGHIVIEIKKQDDMMLCSVDDDGVGRRPIIEASDKHSMGVDITKSRIDILNKLKKTNGTMRIIDKREGVRVEILLPLQLAF